MTAFKWLTTRVVLRMHERSLSDHGGASGLRDEGALEAGLHKPRHHASYSEPDVFDCAALYLLGVGKAHAFVDGNKRTAFLSAYVFLGLNGYELDADQDEAAAITIDAVSDQIGLEGLSTWLRHNSAPVGGDG